ncbi:ubiquitin-like domain-containing protein [Streptomyces sp. AJS327]|uniref:ubiquitin-like domain-containing protein n=1 Tax=Streptomyces sp. AJS327 TaxID=2545265 RepID=UPI0027E57384|nr:ubiquitin-like domain-containing protein [Streptomyces sp. AJS327]
MDRTAERRGGHRARGRGAGRARGRGSGDGGEGLRRLLPQALVVAFLAGGTSAFVAHDRAVTLSVDGKARTLHTFASDVTGLLEREGVTLGPHDEVTPAPDTPLSHGDEVAVGHGRPLRLTLDGGHRIVWTTARTVGGALRELGVRLDGAYLSTPAGTRLGRAGTALEVRTERRVTVLVDGREHTVATNAATVRATLRAAGVDLGADDTTSVPLDAFPRDGQTVAVLRVARSEQVRAKAIAFRTVRRPDPELDQGTELVERAGRAGLRRTLYQVRTVNGVRERPRRVRSEVVREPRDEVVRVGTRRLPTSVRGADGLDWDALARCESGGRPDAVDPSGTYGGLYQFDQSTWRSLGGSGRPQDAPAAEQTLRAKKLYVSRGASPWPVCGRKLSR